MATAIYTLTTNQLNAGIVSPRSFGAVGNGVANDYTAVQRAFDYARDNNKTVLLDGVFNLNNNVITYYAQQTAVGLAGGKSKLLKGKLQSYLFDSLNGNGYSAQAAHGVFFSNFVIDGGKESNTYDATKRGLEHFGSDFIMHNVNVVNCAGDGVYIGGFPPSFTLGPTHIKDYSGNLGQSRIHSCDFNLNNGSGGIIEQQDCLFTDCYFCFNALWGFEITSTNSQRSGGTLFSQCHPYLNTVGGFKVADETDASIIANGSFINCEIEGVEGTAISIGLGGGATMIRGGNVYLAPVGIKCLASVVHVDTRINRCGTGIILGSSTTGVYNSSFKGKINVYPTTTPINIGPPHPYPQYAISNVNPNSAANYFDLQVVLQDETQTTGVNNYQFQSGTNINTLNAGRVDVSIASNGKVVRTQTTGRLVTEVGNTVTINSNIGTITTDTLTTIAGGYTFITLNNSNITATDLIQVTAGNYTGVLVTDGEPIVTLSSVSAGVAVFAVKNIHPTNPLNGTVRINFEIKS